ncbi:hypothetical protein FACS189429_7710 [Bacteroidia bacterium]|nr:hypothetical protein FACS189429_7710 [Bacteroidia bacterium]
MKNKKGIKIAEKALYGLPNCQVIELENITINPICSNGYTDYLFSFTDSQNNTWIPDDYQGYWGRGYSYYLVNAKTEEKITISTRTLRDNDIVYRIDYDDKTSNINIYKVTFGKIEKSVFASDNSKSFFQTSKVGCKKSTKLFKKTTPLF